MYVQMEIHMFKLKYFELSKKIQVLDDEYKSLNRKLELGQGKQLDNLEKIIHTLDERKDLYCEQAQCIIRYLRTFLATVFILFVIISIITFYMR